MRWRNLLLVWIAFLCGCSAERVTVLHAAPPREPRANLALGPSAEHSRLAERFAWRPDWPAVENGYRVDDVTLYMAITYDEQSHYDRFGSFYHQTQSVRTGVLLR